MYKFFDKPDDNLHVRTKMTMSDLYFEKFWIILVSRSNTFISNSIISQVGILGTVQQKFNPAIHLTSRPPSPALASSRERGRGALAGLNSSFKKR
ncbi:MAG: hypothetical protein D4R64_13815 [Porphyromonadaceae bacterium]|nr:MAG: hypothetical protein D4R64_13815 [Porphyromonadaceae bacterium]